MKPNMLIALFMLLWLLMLPVAVADQPPVNKGGSDGGLTDGLMDLLKEPAKPAPALPPKPNSQTAEQDKATGGEDIGQGPSNPLAEVELGMNTLAGWMRSRSDAARTKQLQRDVVLRLDELIGQLEKQSQSQSQSQSSSSSSNASQTSTSQASSQSQPQTPSSAQSKPAAMPQSSSAQSPGQSETKPTDQSSGEQPGLNNQARSGQPNKPNEAGDGNDTSSSEGEPGVSPMRARNVTVDLNDPRALQRSAWGNLPERMREQMQSRMVERFLPPYRDEIEAYYRALVK